MELKRDSILTDLKNHVIELTLEHPQGRYQERFTLDPKYLPENYVKNDIPLQEEFHRLNPEVISAYSIATGQWKSFWANSVTLCQDVTDKYA